MLYLDHIVTHDEDGKMVSSFLEPLHLGKKLRKALHEGNLVQVNGAIVYWSSRVRVGDHITVRAPTDWRDVVPAEDLPLTVTYEDEHVLVVDKPAGMLIHPVGSERSGTLLAAVVNYLKKKQIEDRVFLLHRLDRETSGLVLLAKHKMAQERLVRSLHRRDVHRQYSAFVHGIVSQDDFLIEAPIAKSDSSSTRHIVAENGRYAATKVSVQARCELSGITKVNVTLLTGRTHQIRVHMAHIGHPLIADSLYGQGDNPFAHVITRQALHASTLDFMHPIVRTMTTVNSALPDDMASLEEKFMKKCW